MNTRRVEDSIRGMVRGLWMAMFMAGWVLPVMAASSAGSLLSDPNALVGPHLSQEVEVSADELEYDKAWLRAKGHVVIIRGSDELRADFIDYNSQTGDARARGHVQLRRGDNVASAEEGTYNFRTRKGDIAALMALAPPFQITGSNVFQVSTNAYVVSNAVLTTCSNKLPHTHWHVKARRMRVVPDEAARAYGAVLYLGQVPIMWLPYYYRNLRDYVGVELILGYSSRMGAFVLPTLWYRINETFKGQTHVDYRTRRGPGLGQDLLWHTPDGRTTGEVRTYYAHDAEPFDEDDDPAVSELSNERYRIKVKNHHQITDRDYTLLQATYVSDEDLQEDFFANDYRESSTPDNYFTYTHVEDNLTAGAILRGRLNDFYGSVNRLPELYVDFPRQQLGSSPIYYEGRQSAAFLDRTYSSFEEGSAYSAFRFDSPHMLYYPTKQLGWLMFTPRAGYRGTFYSAGIAGTITNVSSISTNTSGGVSTNYTTSYLESGALFRNRMELGFEDSFKAFSTWESEAGPRRHVVEPYLNYTVNPEPNVLPGELYPFDEIDQLDRSNYVKLGARNKYQRKKDGSPFDMVDADVYTYVKFWRLDTERAIENFYANVEFTPSDYFRFNADAIWNVNESAFSTFNFRANASEPTDTWGLGLEYRFAENDYSLLSEDVTFKPSLDWTFGVFSRYEFEESRMEEYGGYFQRTLDCLVFKTGAGYLPGYTKTDGTAVNEEWRVIFEFWLRAFPETSVQSR